MENKPESPIISAFREWLSSLDPDTTFPGPRNCCCPLAVWFNHLYGKDAADRPAAVSYTRYRTNGRYYETPQWMRVFMSRADVYQRKETAKVCLNILKSMGDKWDE